jgi:phenylpyruvate tautomerase PptA (4-oxalocrotonate tautomerase family)
MPFVTVDHFVGVSPVERQELQRRMATVVMERFGSPAASVRVFTRAFDPADVYVGEGEAAIAFPVIRVEFLPGRTVEQKRGLVVGLAHEAAEVLGVPVAQVRTILYERSLTEWARGDIMMADVSGR